MGERVQLPWGDDETVTLTLPDGWNIKETLAPSRPRTIEDLDAELDRVMKSPTGLSPLGRFAKERGQTVCIVVDDRTRPTPVARILPRVVDELSDAGIRDEDMTVLIALGTHRDMTGEEIEKRLGAVMAKRLRVVNHRYDDPDQVRAVGKTPTHGVPTTFNKLVAEADTVVSIGCIEAHEQAGFGGGYKNLMPGVAGPEPIFFTHNAAFQKPPRISSSGMPREICKFRKAVDECGALLGDKVFIVNVVLDPVEPMAIVAGHPIKAHQEGARIYGEMASVELSEKCDVVLFSSNPLDVDLRVSFKACFNASAALKKGGLFVTVSRAPEGLGDLRLPDRLPSFAGTGVRMVPMKLLEKVGPKFNPSPDQAAGTVSLIKTLRLARDWLYLTTTDGHPALSTLGIKFYNDPEEMMKRAGQIKPRAEVALLPRAGASYIGW